MTNAEKPAGRKRGLLVYPHGGTCDYWADAVANRDAAIRREAERAGRLDEAKWWASKWNQECGFCEEQVGCSECKEPRERIRQLEQGDGK
jgi:hypothetical protein